AIVTYGLGDLTRTSVNVVLAAAVGLGVLALARLWFTEIVRLCGGAALMLVLTLARRARRPPPVAALLPLVGAPIPAATTVAGTAPFSFLTLFLTFLTIGPVLFGSGYVLLAFLRRDFVLRLGWLT